MDDIIEDIQRRLHCMPVYSGSGETIPALPEPETIDPNTYVYPSQHWFMEAVRHPCWPIYNYALSVEDALQIFEQSKGP